MSYKQDVDRVIAAAADVAGDRQRAADWFFNEPISAFRGQTADILVRAGRAQDVLGYIESTASGFAG